MNTALQIRGTQMLMGITIPVVYGGFGERCKSVTAKSVSEIHSMRLSDVNASINRLIVKNRIKSGIDYINLLSETVSLRELARQLDMSNSNRTKDAFILSERGYTKLIKSMDDDKSWDTMDKFVDEYFSLREQKENGTLNQVDMSQLFTCMMNGFSGMLESQNKFYENFNQSMQNFTRIIMTQQKQLTPEELYPNIESTTSSLSLEGQDYKKRVYALCDNIVEHSDFKSSNLVLSHAYRLINRKYGICWDQEVKDYKDNHNLDRNPSLINVIADSDDSKYFKSILMSILEDMVTEYKNKDTSTVKVTNKEVDLVILANTWEEAQKLTIALAQRMNDNSPYAAVTYNRLYKLMDNGINWTYYKTKYKRNNRISARKAIVSKKDMIGCSSKLQNMFIDVLNSKLQEVAK